MLLIIIVVIIIIKIIGDLPEAPAGQEGRPIYIYIYRERERDIEREI